MIKTTIFILMTAITLSLAACSLKYQPVVISGEPPPRRSQETKKPGINGQKPFPNAQKPVQKNTILEQDIQSQDLKDKQQGAASSPPDTGLPGQEQEKKSPRMLASLEITKQARILIDRRKPDDAISMLERAINLEPSNGQNYFYLSEAWLMKGNPDQALEFNGLASVYLGKDPRWETQIAEQKERINQLKAKQN